METIKKNKIKNLMKKKKNKIKGNLLKKAVKYNYKDSQKKIINKK